MCVAEYEKYRKAEALRIYKLIIKKQIQSKIHQYNQHTRNKHLLKHQTAPLMTLPKQGVFVLISDP